MAQQYYGGPMPNQNFGGVPPQNWSAAPMNYGTPPQNYGIHPQSWQPQQQQQQQQRPQQRAQSVEDKNAAYMAKMRRRQATKQQQQKVASDFDEEPTNKISLFGNNDMLQKAFVKKKKKRSKRVQLPNGGITEAELFRKYKIESKKNIGAGAFARIKIIKEISNGKQFALKMVKTKGKSSADIEAFKKEMLFLSKLTNHPNIIKMYDFCESPHGLYMVLEYCNGGDLMQKMQVQKKFDQVEAKHLTKQLVAGISCFHQFNIVHRDLKLDNLMFSNNVLKIIDFGLAGDCTDIALNTPCGTLHFTAPEVLCSYDYNTKADMWSLGVIIYMLICGFPPFLDIHGDQQKLFELIKRAKFEFPNLYFDAFQPCVKGLISKLIVKQATMRLSAQDVRNHEWLTGTKTESVTQPQNYNQSQTYPQYNQYSQNQMNPYAQQQQYGHQQQQQQQQQPQAYGQQQQQYVYEQQQQQPQAYGQQQGFSQQYDQQLQPQQQYVQQQQPQYEQQSYALQPQSYAQTQQEEYAQQQQMPYVQQQQLSGYQMQYDQNQFQ